MKLTPPQVVNYITQLKEQPILIVAVGLPCSGKSTLLNNIQRQLEARGSHLIITGTDLLIDEYAKTHGINYDVAWKKVNFKDISRQFKQKLIETVRAKKNVAVDRTHMVSKSRKGCLLEADKHFKICLNVNVPVATIQERNKHRSQTEGKFIGWGIIESMAKSYTPPSKAEGFDLIIDVD